MKERERERERERKRERDDAIYSKSSRNAIKLPKCRNQKIDR